MANIITKSYFKADIELQKGNYDTLDVFIEKFERECLTYLLGYELYALLVQAMTVQNPPVELSEPFKSLVDGTEYLVGDHKVKWNGLKNTEGISLIAYYVYCEYIRNHVTSTQMVGETTPIAENSNPATIFAKLFSAWNRFEELYGYFDQSELAPSAYNFLMAHQTDFPEWIFTSLYGSINSHDL